MQYIHFTKEAVFSLCRGAGDSISKEYDGLFVYQYTDEFPLSERQREWAYRDAVIIRCPTELVEFVQDDPLGHDCTRDEYLIPCKHFKNCQIIDVISA